MPWRSPKHYLVCATQRSGSTLLAELLEQTGIAGRPREHLLEWVRGTAATDSGGPWLERVRTVLRRGTTPNGVFACKVMASYFERAMRCLETLPQARGLGIWEICDAAFERPQVVRVRRRDCVQQAVSRHVAESTRSWHQYDPDLAPAEWVEASPAAGDGGSEAEVRYDHAAIRGFLLENAVGDAWWDHHLAGFGIAPVEVVYEDLVADMPGTVDRVLVELGLGRADVEPVATTRRASGGLKAELSERFRDECARHGDDVEQLAQAAAERVRRAT